ncbi:hypothetical protein SANTM175S_08539 [Streptomyces antimycoticus]
MSAFSRWRRISAPKRSRAERSGKSSRGWNSIVYPLLSRDALSAYVPPPPSVLAAYADEPALGVLHLELRDALRISFTSALLGVLPRLNLPVPARCSPWHVRCRGLFR